MSKMASYVRCNCSLCVIASIRLGAKKLCVIWTVQRPRTRQGPAPAKKPKGLPPVYGRGRSRLEPALGPAKRPDPGSGRRCRKFRGLSVQDTRWRQRCERDISRTRGSDVPAPRSRGPHLSRYSPCARRYDDISRPAAAFAQRFIRYEWPGQRQNATDMPQRRIRRLRLAAFCGHHRRRYHLTN
jgi:hypothetical protein